MNHRHLLLQSVWALAACVALVVACYEFVDRPVAFWIHDHFLSEGFWIKPTADIGPWLMFAAPPTALVLAIRRLAGPWRPWELRVFAVASALLLTYVAKVGLKWFFGRPWPETWIYDNPSLIRNQVYDFHWFEGGRLYGSFPSGHTAAVCSIAAIVWVAWPAARWCAVLAVVLMVAALVGNDYHFVGDCVAGGFLGWMVGLWTALVLGIRSRHKGEGNKPNQQERESENDA